MRFCLSHWADLRVAITERGLDHLVAQSGKAAMDSTVRQLEGQDDKHDFDPLMNANWAIMGAYTRDVGLSALIGEKCPLCEVEAWRAGLAKNWITGAADDQLHAARVHGLAPEVS